MSSSGEAAGLIISHCPVMGRYAGDLTPLSFLNHVADEMEAAHHTDLFPERYKEHVAYALRTVARHHFLESPAALASVYLVTRFEFYFRLLSGKLKGDGTWLNKAVDQPIAISKLGDKGLKGARVSEVAKTYKLMKLDSSRPAAQAFDALDKAIFAVPKKAVGGFHVGDTGDRIAFGRHSAGHGLWGDISSEAVFYGLVTAIIFYAQSK